MADFRSTTADNRQQILRHAGFISQNDQCIRTQRRERCRFNYHRTAHRQSRRSLARNHRRREVPRRNRSGNADRLFQYNQFLRRFHTCQHIAVNPPRLFRKPAHKRSRIINFTTRLSQAFALLHRHDTREFFFVFFNQKIPAPQHIGPLQRSFCRP